MLIGRFEHKIEQNVKQAINGCSATDPVARRKNLREILKMGKATAGSGKALVRLAANPEG